MAIKRRYVMASSEPYKDGTIRPPGELEAAVRRVTTVPLTLGHPPKGARGIPEDILLGKVEYHYDSDGSRTLGNSFFYDEYWERIPEGLRDKIVNHEPIPISQGYGFTWQDDSDESIITDIVPNHVAVLTDEEPLCPLNECGVNVRMESSPENFRYEQRIESTNPDVKKVTEEIIMDETVELTDIKVLEAKVDELISFIKDNVPVIADTPVVVEDEVKESKAEEIPQKVPENVSVPEPIPVRDTPASVPSSQDDFERDPITGGIVLSNRHDRRK